MAFKMKGNPMARNFGIGKSAAKDYDVNKGSHDHPHDGGASGPPPNKMYGSVKTPAKHNVTLRKKDGSTHVENAEHKHDAKGKTKYTKEQYKDQIATKEEKAAKIEEEKAAKGKETRDKSG